MKLRENISSTTFL